MGERLLCKQEVAGSIPAGSTVGKCCKYVTFSPMGIRATRVPVAGRGARGVHWGLGSVAPLLRLAPERRLRVRLRVLLTEAMSGCVIS